MKLVIVESPSKCKKIFGILKHLYPKEKYQVIATVGHFKDLPRKKMGIDFKTWTPELVMHGKREKDVAAKLVKEAEKATEIYLATDPDREGDGIAACVAELLGENQVLVPIYRTAWTEITSKAIKKAIDNPGQLDQLSVDSQRARRILDRMCFTGSTHVMTDYDLCVPIKEIYKNKYITHVLSYNLEEGSIEKKQIIRKIKKAHKGVLAYVTLQVSGEKQTLVCTTDHEFFVVGEEEPKSAGDLTKGDLVYGYVGKFNKKYTCPYCGDIFEYKYFGTHVQKEHCNYYSEKECPECGNVVKHLSAHMWFSHTASDEELQERQKKISASWELMSEDQKNAIYDRRRQSKKKWWKGLSEEERETLFGKIQKSVCEHLASLSPEEKKRRVAKMLKTMSEKSPEELEKIKQKRRDWWANLSPERKAEMVKPLINHEYDGKINKAESNVLALGIEGMKFVGDGSLFVTLTLPDGSYKHKNPDFVIKENGKVTGIVEIMDFQYWHTLEEAQMIQDCYADIGYKCLIVDADRCYKKKDLSGVRAQIEAEFHNHYASVENVKLRGCHEIDVYDLTVEDNHNYFVLRNEKTGFSVLAHNCGYTISPVLWKTIGRGLAAGRVQTCALKLIIDREIERRDFEPVTKYRVKAKLKDQEVHAYSDWFEDEAGAKALMEDIEEHQDDLQVSFTSEEELKKPWPPFKTSTILQTGMKVTGKSSKDVMEALQTLFQRGYCSYHRTDSIKLSGAAIGDSRDYLKKKQPKLLFKKARNYPAPKGAQAAHEAIRPTHMDQPASTLKLTDINAQVYNLIWARTLCTQAIPATIENQTMTFSLPDGAEVLTATGTKILEEGWRKLALNLPIPQYTALDPLQFTLEGPEPDSSTSEPPYRYTEMSMIQKLEDTGIGRPSTYVQTIQTIRRHGYLRRMGKVLRPSEKGEVVVKYLENTFAELVSTEFTANMEAALDKIAEGDRPKNDVLQEYKDWLDPLVKVAKTMLVIADDPCPACGKELKVWVSDKRAEPVLKCLGCSTWHGFAVDKKTSRYGVFVPEPYAGKCEKCKKEALTTARSKYGNYVKCSDCGAAQKTVYID